MTLAVRPKQWLWTWSGISFGYREGDELWTHTGRHAGRFDGAEVYDSNGCYLGEVRRPGRLIVDTAKLAQRRPPFFPLPPRRGVTARGRSVVVPLPADYMDFPPP